MNYEKFLSPDWWMVRDSFLTGSRAILGTETGDVDICLLVPEADIVEFERLLTEAGWVLNLAYDETSKSPNTLAEKTVDGTDVDLIIISERNVYEKWHKATTSARALRITSRADRIEHFRQVRGDWKAPQELDRDFLQEIF